MKSSKGLEASEWSSFLPVCKEGEMRCRPKEQWQPLPPSPIPGRAGKNAETQDRRSSAGNSKKHQSTLEGQSWARAQANPLLIRSAKEEKEHLLLAQPCYRVGPRS